jgi:hypothetical protein
MPPDPRPWQTGWQLPALAGNDPLLVAVLEQQLQHFTNRHLAPGVEPWDELFGLHLAGRLAGAWDAETRLADRHAILTEVSDRLGRQAREALSRPLVLDLETCLGSGRFLYRTLCLVLPAGALAVLRQRAGSWALVTAYFPRATVSEPPARRWKAAVADLVRRYCFTPPALVPPEPGRRFEVRASGGPVHEIRRNLRFHVLHTWGFATDLEGNPWRGNLPDWPAAPAVPPSRPRRLAPRRQRQGHPAGAPT